MFDDLSLYGRHNRIIGQIGLPWWNTRENTPSLAVFSIKWNHLIDKDSLKIKDLEHVLIEKVEQLFSGHALMPIEILAVTKAFVSVMPMFSGGDVQKRPEAALLRVIKTFVERLCCIGEFF
jgi:hypothetical protein